MRLPTSLTPAALAAVALVLAAPLAAPGGAVAAPSRPAAASAPDAVAAAQAPAQAQAQAQARAQRTVRLDGVGVRLGTRTRQVVTVRHTGGHHARVTLWQYRWRDGRGAWRAVARTADGRIGYGGLVWPQQRRQGTGTTPLGTHRLPWAFGTRGEQWNWSLPYRQIRTDDFWVQDNASPHYNRYRNARSGGFRWWLRGHPESSERLTDYGRQYEFAVVTDFNYREQVRRRGSGIFLHVNGSGATAGCISVPRSTMVRAMQWLDPADDPVIAVGR